MGATGNSLERIEQYIDIDQEPLPTTNGQPPASWPTTGDLQVEKLSARYSDDGPNVLQDVTFKCTSGEKVGIGKWRYCLGSLHTNLYDSTYL